MKLDEYIAKTVEEINQKTRQLSNVIGMGEILELLKYQDLTQGKKIRAVMCVLVNDTLGGNHGAALDYALAVEMTHQASLVHDDVVDGDTFRRGKLALHERFGVGKAILFGDMLISFAVNALRDMSPIEFYKGGRVMADTWRVLTHGAYMEHTMHKNPDEASYVKMVQYKTGILFESACRLGAASSKASDEMTDLISKYGMCVGTAFQVADDIVDVIKSVKAGKYIGDLKDRRVTLPIIYLKKMYDNELISKYIDKKDMTEDEVKEFLQLIKTSTTVETTQSYVEQIVNKAFECIEVLPDGDYKSMLTELPEYAVKALMSEVYQ